MNPFDPTRRGGGGLFTTVLQTVVPDPVPSSHWGPLASSRPGHPTRPSAATGHLPVVRSSRHRHLSGGRDVGWSREPRAPAASDQRSVGTTVGVAGLTEGTTPAATQMPVRILIRP